MYFPHGSFITKDTWLSCWHLKNEIENPVLPSLFWQNPQRFLPPFCQLLKSWTLTSSTRLISFPPHCTPKWLPNPTDSTWGIFPGIHPFLSNITSPATTVTSYPLYCSPPVSSLWFIVPLYTRAHWIVEIQQPGSQYSYSRLPRSGHWHNDLRVSSILIHFPQFP